MTPFTVESLISKWLASESMEEVSLDELEFAIGCLVGFPGFVMDEHGIWSSSRTPRFTRCFRAALSLVPEDCEWVLRGDKAGPACETAIVSSWREPRENPLALVSERQADKDTPEEALAAAAVKAVLRLRQAGYTQEPVVAGQSDALARRVQESL